MKLRKFVAQRDMNKWTPPLFRGVQRSLDSRFVVPLNSMIQRQTLYVNEHTLIHLNTHEHVTISYPDMFMYIIYVNVMYIHDVNAQHQYQPNLMQVGYINRSKSMAAIHARSCPGKWLELGAAKGRGTLDSYSCVVLSKLRGTLLVIIPLLHSLHTLGKDLWFSHCVFSCFLAFNFTMFHPVLDTSDVWYSCLGLSKLRGTLLVVIPLLHCLHFFSHFPSAFVGPWLYLTPIGWNSLTMWKGSRIEMVQILSNVFSS